MPIISGLTQRLFCSSDDEDNVSLNHIKLYKLHIVGFDGVSLLFILKISKLTLFGYSIILYIAIKCQCISVNKIDEIKCADILENKSVILLKISSQITWLGFGMIS